MNNFFAIALLGFPCAASSNTSISRLLNMFLEENQILFCRELTNKTSVSFSIESEIYLDKIKNYYAEDYAIKINYGCKSEKIM